MLSSGCTSSIDSSAGELSLVRSSSIGISSGCKDCLLPLLFATLESARSDEGPVDFTAGVFRVTDLTDLDRDRPLPLPTYTLFPIAKSQSSSSSPSIRLPTVLLLRGDFPAGVTFLVFDFEATGVPIDFRGRPRPRFGGAAGLSSSESERPLSGTVVVVVRVFGRLEEGA